MKAGCVVLVLMALALIAGVNIAFKSGMLNFEATDVHQPTTAVTLVQADGTQTTYRTHQVGPWSFVRLPNDDGAILKIGDFSLLVFKGEKACFEPGAMPSNFALAHSLKRCIEPQWASKQ